MTTDELNAIVQAVMLEMEKAGVDFDFKAEEPQADDLVYVMRGTSDKYQGITVKWQNLLDLIVKKATDAKNEAVSAKDIALQTLATIQGIESNVSSMKSSVDASESNVASMKASVETSEANVTQMKSEVSEMKTSVEGTKTEVEGLKSDVTALKAQTQTIVDNAKEDVTGLLDTKVDYTDALTYEQIMASTDLTNKVASAESVYKMNDTQDINFNLTNCTGAIAIKRKGKLMNLTVDITLNVSTSIGSWFNLGTIDRDIGIYYGAAYPPVINISTGTSGILQIYGDNGITKIRTQINGSAGNTLRTSAMMIAK